MAEQRSDQNIIAVIPAYNEAKRLGKVLDVVTNYHNFKKIIVVDDGSTDETSLVAKKYPIHLIRLAKNYGKGETLRRAIEKSTAEIIFCCDADITGLTKDIIDEIITPVLEKKVDMFIAMRNRKLYFFQFILPIIPLLGGERAFTRSLWNKVPDYYKTKFRIETGLNFYAKRYGQGYDFKIFKNLTQTIKEKKYGFWPGFKARVKMYYDIIDSQIKLRTNKN